MSPIRISIIEPNQVMMEGFIRIFGSSPTVKLVGHFKSGSEALKSIASFPVDVLLTDLNSQDLDAISLVHKLSKVSPDTKVVVNGIVDPGPLIKLLLNSGVSTYFLKTSVSADKILEIIKNVYTNGYSITSVVTRSMLYNLWFKDMEANCPCLSLRERQILDRICNGMSKSEIADSLFISQATVKYHLVKIFEKCEVANSSELVAKAFNNKWVSWIQNEARRMNFEKIYLS